MNYIKAIKTQLVLTTLAMEIIADVSRDKVLIENAKSISAQNAKILSMSGDEMMNDTMIAEQFTDEPEEELPDDLRKEFDMIFDEIVRADNYDVE